MGTGASGRAKGISVEAGWSNAEHKAMEGGAFGDKEKERKQDEKRYTGGRNGGEADHDLLGNDTDDEKNARMRMRGRINVGHVVIEVVDIIH